MRGGAAASGGEVADENLPGTCPATRASTRPESCTVHIFKHQVTNYNNCEIHHYENRTYFACDIILANAVMSDNVIAEFINLKAQRIIPSGYIIKILYLC